MDRLTDDGIHRIINLNAAAIRQPVSGGEP